MADDTFYSRIDKLLRDGRGAEAQPEIERWAAAKPSRRDLAPLARLAWRAGLPLVGLKLLHRHVRGDFAKTATAQERHEYAMCLARLGATEEALGLLDNGAPLYRAFTFIHCWNYADAIPLLLEYLQSKPKRYDAIVAKVNLASAFLNERRFLETEGLLKELLHECSLTRYRFALGVVMELTASHHVLTGRFDDAKKFLARSKADLAGAHPMHAFLTEKWEALCELRRSNGSADALASLEKVRAAAKKLGHGETVRDCDRHEAVVRGDEPLAQRLYLGTPYESFRRRLREEFPGGFAPASSYAWELTPGGTATVDPAAQLKPKQRLARTLAALCADFYRPQRIATLHGIVYPGDFFNPLSGPHRVHQAVNELRRWFDRGGMPLLVEESQGAYQLASRVPCRILVTAVGVAQETAELRRLREQWSSTPFSVTQAALTLDASPRSALRVLKEALERGELERTGRAKTTRYRFR